MGAHPVHANKRDDSCTGIGLTYSPIGLEGVRDDVVEAYRDTEPPSRYYTHIGTHIHHGRVIKGVRCSIVSYVL